MSDTIEVSSELFNHRISTQKIRHKAQWNGSIGNKSVRGAECLRPPVPKFLFSNFCFGAAPGSSATPGSRRPCRSPHLLFFLFIFFLWPRRGRPRGPKASQEGPKAPHFFFIKKKIPIFFQFLFLYRYTYERSSTLSYY